MKPLFNDHTLRQINRVAIPVVIAMSLSTAVLPFLKSTTSESPQLDSVAFYDIYHLGSVFALHIEEGGVTMKQVKQDVLTPVPHRLNAVYSDGSQAFVAIDDGTSTTFVNYGEMYKKLYRLVSISPDSAIFSAYGKRMTLRLGEEGVLNLKESVMTYVAEKNAASSASTYVVSRATIERYNQNLNRVWKNISIDEVREQGKTTGFRIKKIAPDTPFALLGLQRGDIITGIDNKPLNSFAAAYAAYKTALRRPAIKITILRNNQTKDLEYEISR